MKKEEFLALMNFPDEWEYLQMYPDELAEIQLRQYRRGQERSSEHVRLGAIMWWIANSRSSNTIAKLTKLAQLDGDQLMATFALEKIAEYSLGQSSSDGMKQNPE